MTAVRQSAATAASGGDRAEAPAGKTAFHVFVIDSGWSSTVRQVVHENMDLFRSYLKDHQGAVHEHSVFVLSPEQSTALLRKHPHYIAADPCLLVLPVGGDEVPGATPDGVCLNLGHAKTRKQVIMMMRWLCELLCTRIAAGKLREVVRRTAHKEGMSGAIEIIVDTVSHTALEAE